MAFQRRCGGGGEVQTAEDVPKEKVIREPKLRQTDAHLCSFKTFLNYNFSTNYHQLFKIQ